MTEETKLEKKVELMKAKFDSDIISLREIITELKEKISNSSKRAIEDVQPFLGYVENTSINNSIGVETILRILIENKVVNEEKVKEVSKIVSEEMKKRYDKFIAEVQPQDNVKPKE